MVSYGRAATPADLDRAWQSMVIGNQVDFGRLDEAFQEAAVRRVATDPLAKGELEMPALPVDPDPQRITGNRDAIRQHLGLERYAERLLDIYGALAGSTTGSLSQASADTLLDAFLDPGRLHLLKV